MVGMTRPTRRIVGVAAVLLAAAAPAASGAAAPREPPTAQTVRLSDELTLSRWAHPHTRSRVRRSPSDRSPTVARLHFDTEDGLSEVYLALRSYTDPEGRRWVQIRLPGRPNGQAGWVRGDALEVLHRVTTMLRIDRRTLRATLYRDGRTVWRAPVGVGKASTPTPAGRFYVRERLHVPESNTIYGPLAFGTSAYARLSDWPGGGVVGIHGTNEPRLIPGRPSHGCVRLQLRDLRRLGRLMPIGTPVRIV